MDVNTNDDTSPKVLTNRKLVCIEYPAIVKNEDKMLKTLGGIKNISNVYSEKNRRLELRFRPEDIYCRPTCADKKQVSSILLKIRILKKKKKDFDQNEKDNCDGEIIDTPIILGRIQTMFRFSSLCDFQYLPIHSDGLEMKYIYDTLVPKGLLTPDWFSEPAEYFLPPATFSRMDSMQNYQYRSENTDSKDPATPYIIGRTRRRRSGHAMFVSFNVDSVPSKPREIVLKFLDIKFLSGGPLQKIRELFEERPIWSKVALLAITKFPIEHIKYLLPAVAYYFVTGPFRIMWVRFGYDPRKDPSSRIYQCVDYRIRVHAGYQNTIKAKRSCTNYLLPYKSTPASRPKTVVIKSKSALESKEISETEMSLKDSSYIFRADTIPPSRQMFYQLCDIKVPEIENMVARLPRIPPGTQCHERLGWLPPGFAEQCRDIISGIVTELLRKEQNNSPQPSTSSANQSIIEDEELEGYWSADPSTHDDDLEWEDV
uniref:General transcription factor 3C polypeptide 5 n=2 Tax=Clastoptera arizonana TaxID=38151 RepID=A0A1B6DG43_9HEMI